MSTDFDTWVEQRVSAVRTRLPAHYRDVTVEHPEIRDWCRKVAMDHGSANLLIQGPKGTGKTGNAWAAWPHLISLGWVGSWKAMTEIGYLDNLHGDKLDALSARRARVMLLDDLGSAAPSDWSRSRVFALIDDRWSAGLPTIVTSNLTGSQLEHHLGDRAASRLASAATVLTLTGPDRRLT